MNYIIEVKMFYEWLETNSVSDSAINLWHALLHINNKASNRAEWKEEFAVAISVLQTKTSLSKSTIIRARNQLKQLGRIDFKERKGNQSAVYSLIAFHTETQSGTQSEPQSGTQSGTQTGTQSDTINKPNYTEPNKTKHSKSHSGDKPPAEEKKGKVLYWKSLVGIWFDFYKKKFSQKPTFPSSTAANFKIIIQNLKKFSEEKGFEWTEDYAKKCLNHFLQKAYEKDDWLKNNFLVGNLLQQFDAIVKPQENGNPKNSKQGNSGNINVQSAFAKVDKLYSET